MTYSLDIRWRGIVLMYIHSIDISTVYSVLGISDRSLARWYKLFRTTGNVLKEFVTAHPCFYFEDLRYELRTRYKDSIGVSDATICRALRFDLKLTRKVLTKRARESVPRERRECAGRLTPFYSGPDQIDFIDETSKDGRSVLLRYGWSARNTPAHATLPFSRGKRVSALVAMDLQGFFCVG
ncbi:hypothetical protein PC123_g18417 [Phytophthora cactorum]|nr:hypothetical protein PC123_g18417 [Phytophthora cactorum]